MRRLRTAGGFIVTLPIALLLSFTLQPKLTGQGTEKEKPNNHLAAPALVARATTRIERDLKEIRVFRNNQPVKLVPFQELLAATPVGGAVPLDSLVGKSVALIRSLEEDGQWEIYTGVGGVGKLILPGNIFIIREVFLASSKEPIQVRVNGRMHHLKPGQALIVLR